MVERAVILLLHQHSRQGTLLVPQHRLILRHRHKPITIRFSRLILHRRGTEENAVRFSLYRDLSKDS